MKCFDFFFHSCQNCGLYLRAACINYFSSYLRLVFEGGFYSRKYGICNFADDTTLYACGKELNPIFFKPEIDTSRAIKWLKNDEMVANPSKFQLTFLSKYRNIEKNTSFDGKTIKSSDTIELLGITLNKNINFKRHIQNICRKANNETKVLLRIRKICKP